MAREAIEKTAAEAAGYRRRIEATVRRVLHCDMDCFYAAVHARDDPSLRGMPVVVGGPAEGRGVVAAASYEARRYGIHSAMSSAVARRLCPQAVFIAPDFPRYRSESEAVFELLRRFSPAIQPVSIDEAYLDVTDHYRRWGSATAMAEEIRRHIGDERGLTVSIGVGPNKLVAKIASDFRKPNGLTVVRPERVAAFLAPLPVRRLPGVGPATDKRLQRSGIRCIADLLCWSEVDLVRRFGRFGRRLARQARGEDDRPVRVRRGRKSLSTERTYPEDLSTLEVMDRELSKLAERIAGSLERKQLKARTVVVKVRYSDFSTVTRSMRLSSPSSDPARLVSLSRALLRRTEAGERPVRLLGIGTSGLVASSGDPLPLFETLGDV